MQEFDKFKQIITKYALEIGFSQLKVSNLDLNEYKQKYYNWINQNMHADMDFMTKHGDIRLDPSLVMPNCLRVISLSLDYMPKEAKIQNSFNNVNQAYISRYALGRDYHKTMRQMIKQLIAKIKISKDIEFNFRICVDTAPILEKIYALQSGIGWQGKNSLILNENSSWFFLGEILIDLPLSVDKPVENQCNKCSNCIKLCPTDALKPYVLDSNLCISYHTIENKKSIPIHIREKMGNRIYGCDDCQIVCPYTRNVNKSNLSDFQVRNNLNNISLIDAFKISKIEFETKMAGSPIYRLGYARWIRNVAVALGNSTPSLEKIKLLQSKLNTISTEIDEHIQWAISKLELNLNSTQKIDKKYKISCNIIYKELSGL